ncbi:uncharacterized protein EAF01_009748 [Botrytis porri]|uniref:2EXR domain-containing protein n=1 Tax=Botrytis porri TaxID=87229 RepID=A0A4Z1KCS6_9HELO|nr:uncharacterized protein EAF01_009748 [Botrytis porri]KAF7895786.1 hypothetical protein EAF01_009748 [Botrytis porri]TGO83148.1 hypothetical protein BPOR_0695g00050 [Botrytis porri]
MPFKFSKIHLYAFESAKITAWVIGGIVCGPTLASIYFGHCLGLVAHSEIKSHIREAKSRKSIKSSSPRNFRTFKMFKFLPKELQSAVWNFALQEIEPRTVKLQLYWWQYKVYRSGSRDFLGSILTAKHKYKAKIPALLHICQDSRDIAQKKYKLSFGKLLQGRPVYFDIERDTLWVVGGRDHCREFPLRLLGMEGFQNLIITPSPRHLCINAPATSNEPLQQWLDRLVSCSIAANMRIQIVLEQVDRIDKGIGETNAERLCDAVRNLSIHDFHPSVEIVLRERLDFGGGLW